ncbi:MAG: hypothetical protein IKU37_06705 [Candidatus Gastranaerophilales bacterium]|nr:hypothetical protein [Candidatus Gastranaerophilales bacterium]
MIVNNISFCAQNLRKKPKQPNKNKTNNPAQPTVKRYNRTKQKRAEGCICTILAIVDTVLATCGLVNYATRQEPINTDDTWSPSSSIHGSAPENIEPDLGITFDDPTTQNEDIESADLGFEINLSPEQKYSLEKFVQNWEENSNRYFDMEEQTGVPAELIAAIHWRESNGNFGTYLHNGAKLGKPIQTFLGERTYYTWEESAKDALSNYAQPKKIVIGDIETYYAFAERYNGMGYSKYHNMYSPYVWSGTNLYTSGKYVADGKFDPNAIDEQVGVAVLLNEIMS